MKDKDEKGVGRVSQNLTPIPSSDLAGPEEGDVDTKVSSVGGNMELPCLYELLDAG